MSDLRLQVAKALFIVQLDAEDPEVSERLWRKIIEHGQVELWLEEADAAIAAMAAEREADRLALAAAREEIGRLTAGIEGLVSGLAHDEFDGTLDLDGIRSLDALRALLAGDL